MTAMNNIDVWCGMIPSSIMAERTAHAQCGIDAQLSRHMLSKPLPKNIKNKIYKKE